MLEEVVSRPMTFSVGIVDYGMGNLGSIMNMIKRVGGRAFVSSQAHELERADRLILPGVGHFARGMDELKRRHLIPYLVERVIERKSKILGICLGAQLMTKFSEEGSVDGLGWIQATTRRFVVDPQLKIPHMGWNEVVFKKESRLLKGLPSPSRFYFVHSYYLESEESEDILMTSHYGKDFVCAFEKENRFACQFHPEKSHKFGMIVIKNFLDS